MVVANGRTNRPREPSFQGIGWYMERLGVFATDEEGRELTRLVREAQRTPVIVVGSGPDMATRAWEAAYKRIHATAMAHGLPEIDGFYGFDGSNNEFLAM